MNSYNEKQNSQPQKPADFKESIALYLHDLVLYVSIIVLVFLLLFRVIVVSGVSMYDTLLNRDYLLLESNLLYRNPEPGDIIVVSKQSFDNGTPIVKRIIATEGQIVDIDFDLGIVYVDGIPLQEDYVNTPTNLEEGMSFPILIEKDCYFVLGDNRNNSRDSRSPEIGQVDRREILGKAIFLIFPAADPDTKSRDLDRIGVIK